MKSDSTKIGASVTVLLLLHSFSATWFLWFYAQVTQAATSYQRLFDRVLLLVSTGAPINMMKPW